MKKLFWLSIFALFSISLSSQNVAVDSLLKSNQFQKAKAVIKSIADPVEQKLVLTKYYITSEQLDSSFYTIFSIDTTRISDLQKGYYHQYLARALDKNNEYDLSYSHYIRAKDYFTRKGINNEVYKIDHELYKITGNKNYLDTFFEASKKLNDYESLSEASIAYALYDVDLETKKEVFKYLDDALHYNSYTENYDQKGRILQIKGLVYGEVLGELDSAIYYYDLSDKTFQERLIDSSYLFYSLMNRASIENQKGNQEIAVQHLLKADSIPLNSYRIAAKRILYNHLANTYETIGDYENAFRYSLLKGAYSDSLNFEQQNINLSRFESEKKERENLILLQKNKANQLLFYGTAVALFIVIVIGLLIYKNLKTRQLIAEQEKLIEIQKTENLLKTQELNALDAMLLGQEKERQRLAGELHDNVGATLTAVKIQFNHIQKNYSPTEELRTHFDKTHKLLEEAYQEIRTLAHLKNSGVIAKNGLLPAITQLAKNTSGVKNLTIEVADFGLEDRLENTLEIAIFRIIQELVTNIIKHAQATDASISLTNHKDVLNIIVEDNGIGFDTKKMRSSSGMGISNIEKRVEHLGGSMEIDSSPKKGTSIIINIPL